MENSQILLALSVAIVIFIFSIVPYFMAKNNEISLYFSQLIIFFIFYPATYILGYAIAQESYDLEIYGYSLISYDIFILSFIISYNIFRVLFLSNRNKISTGPYHPKLMPICIFFLFLLAVVILLRWSNGILFHIAINPEYNLNAAAVENIVKILTSACIVPPLLLIIFNRINVVAVRTGFFLIFIFIFIHIPTGLRSATLIPLVAFIITGIFYRVLSLKIILPTAIILILSVILQGNIRVDQKDRSFDIQDNAILFVTRMSDLRNTGLMVDLMDQKYLARGFDNLDNYYLCYMPNILRSFTDIQCNYNESTQFTEEIGVAPSWSSEPITLIGDSFTRFRAFGLILVGILFGFLIFLNDKMIRSFKEPIRAVYFIILFQLTFSIYSASIINMLLILTRDSLILFIILKFYKIIEKYFNEKKL